MDEESLARAQAFSSDLIRRARAVKQQLVPGMTVDEALRVVAREPGLSLRQVDADDPVVTMDFVFGRIDVYVRNGKLVDADSVDHEED